jgi:hypothetical protein
MKVETDLTLLSPGVRAVVEAMTALAEVAPADVVGPVALEDTRALLAVKEQLDTHLLHRVRDIEVRQLHELDHDLHEGGKTLLLKDGRLLGPDGWVRDIAA